MSKFQGIAKIKVAELIKSQPGAMASPAKGNALAPVAVNQQVGRMVGNAYVDLIELDEAIALYYVGELDRVDIAHCNGPLTELVPGRPLISQLDQDSMMAAIDQLPLDDALLLEAAHYHKCAEAAYAEVLLKLSDIIAKTL